MAPIAPMALTDLSLDRLGGKLHVAVGVPTGLDAAALTIQLDSGDIITAAIPKSAAGTGLRTGRLQVPVTEPFQILSITLLDVSGTALQALTIPMKAIPNAGTPRVALGHASVDCRNGTVALAGWIAPTDGTNHAVRAGLNGIDLGTVFPTIKRPDLKKSYPLLETEVQGWAIETHLTPPPKAPVVLTLDVMEKGKGMTARIQTVLGPGQVQHASALLNRIVSVGNTVSALLVRLLRPAVRPLVRSLLASASFQRLWAAGDRSLALRFRQSLVNFALRHHLVDGTIDIRLKSGHLVRCDINGDKVIARRFLLDGGYENAFIDTMQRLAEPGDIALDIGAAYGAVSMALADAVGDTGKVFAVEADPAKIENLKDAFDRNHCRNITLVAEAIADMPGTLDFLRFATNPGGSRLVLDRSEANVARIMEELASLTVCSLDERNRGRSVTNQIDATDFVWHKVPVTTIDDIVKRYGLSEVALIKMDIEGAELLALRGAAALLGTEKARRPIVVLEYSKLFAQQGGGRNDIFQLLPGPDWRCFVLAGGKDKGGAFREIFSDEDCPNHENLFFVPEGHSRMAHFENVRGAEQ